MDIKLLKEGVLMVHVGMTVQKVVILLKCIFYFDIVICSWIVCQSSPRDKLHLRQKTIRW